MKYDCTIGFKLADAVITENVLWGFSFFNRSLTYRNGDDIILPLAVLLLCLDCLYLPNNIGRSKFISTRNSNLFFCETFSL